MHDIRPHGPSRSSRAIRIIAAGALMLAALAMPLAAESRASASTHGAGEYDSGHWHGSYMEDGAYAYCLDYHLDWDGGASPTWAGTVTSYGALAPGQLSAIGAAVAAFGQTSDAAEGRAVADAIWFVTDGIAPWGPTAGRAQQIIDWMAAWVAAPDSGTVAMRIVQAGSGGRDAVLTIDSMSAGSAVAGMIQLADGVFVDTGGDTLVGEFTAGQSFAIRGLPSSGAPYRIGATLTGTSTLSDFGPGVPVYTYGDFYQGMAGPASVAVIPMTGSALEAEARSAVSMTTRTAATAPVGSPIRDTAIVDDLGAGLDLAGWTIGFALHEFPDADTPVCTAETLVFTSSEVPIAAAGDVASDPYLVERPGLYGWVATLYDAGHAPQAVGVCGDPDETVLVEPLTAAGAPGAPVLAVTGDTSAAIGLTLAGGLALGGAGFAAAAANERRRRG